MKDYQTENNLFVVSRPAGDSKTGPGEAKFPSNLAAFKPEAFRDKVQEGVG